MHVRNNLLACLFLVATTLLVYWQVVDFQFLTHWDDGAYVINNEKVLPGFTQEGLAWSLATFHSGNWHPLTWWSLMLDIELFGPDPGGFHLVNLLLHLANGLLLYFFLTKAAGQLFPALLVSMLFLLHPLHIESVAWISERKDLLSTLFLLLTLMVYADYRQRPARYKYALVLLLFTLGLMAKAMLITLPFMLVLLDYWPLNHQVDTPKHTRWRLLWARLFDKWPLMLVTMGFSILTLVAQSSQGAVSSMTNISVFERVSNAVYAYVTYLKMTLIPTELSFFYPLVGSIEPLVTLLLLLFLFAIMIAGWRLYRVAPFVLIGYFWYLGTLVPVIGLVQIGSQQHADRYTYVPLIGVFILFSYGISQLVQRITAENARRFSYGFVLLLLTGLAGATTYSELQYWENEEKLFSQAINRTENNYRAHELLAEYYHAQRQYLLAKQHIETSLEIKPLRPTALMTLGVVHVALGNQDIAKKAFNSAWQLDAKAFKAPFNLGLMALQTGQLASAKKLFGQAQQLNPRYPPIHLALANTYYMEGDYEQSVQHNLSALALNRLSFEAQFNLALAYEKMGRFRKALAHYEIAGRLNNQNINLYYRLGNLSSMLGEYTKAEGALRRVLELSPGHSGAQAMLEKLERLPAGGLPSNIRAKTDLPKADITKEGE